MGILTSMFGGKILSIFTDKIFASVGTIFQAYFNKQISQAQALAAVQEAIVGALKDIEVAYAQSLSSTFASFMGAVKESKVLQYGWLTVVLSQVTVLVVHQLIVPFAAVMGWLEHPWRSGTTIDYAYLLLSVCMGAGAIALKGSPSGIAGTLKSLIK